MRDTLSIPATGDPLTELALTFPVLPGKDERVERLATDLNGPKVAEFRRSQQGLGILKESWFLNRTPLGISVTIYLEATDVARALGTLIASQDPIDLWLKAEVQWITGIDFNAASPLSLPKQLLRYRS